MVQEFNTIEGVYSRMTMILASKDSFHKRPKDVSIDIEER